MYGFLTWQCCRDDPSSWTVVANVYVFSTKIQVKLRQEKKMKRKRRNHSPSFEPELALAAVPKDRTPDELAAQFDLRLN